MRTLVLWLCACGVAEAACVSVAAPPVPRPLRHAVAYALAVDAGHDEEPTDGQGLQVGQSSLDDICFQSFDPTLVITEAAMTTRYQADEVARQAATTDLAQKAVEFETLLAGLEGDEGAWSSLTTAQKLAVAKKLLRLEVLKRQLGRE